MFSARIVGNKIIDLFKIDDGINKNVENYCKDVWITFSLVQITIKS